MRFTSLLVGVGDRRQPTPRPSPSQEGKTEDRRNGNYRGGNIQQLIMNNE
ncbi:MAG: hypothetical protein F6K24_11340 [Okeania sp. SIO2D1]|nr:hypothetical protein [Okeania sp. SIO2D1]